MRVVFRVDASRTIGSGHVMRCLTLAERLSAMGAACTFVSRAHPGSLIELVRGRGFEVAALPVEQSFRAETPSSGYAHWLGSDWEEDAAATLSALGSLRPDWMLVDHYALDARWERLVRPACGRLAVVDDLADRPHDCDLLLDQNAVANADARYEDKVPCACHLMLGPRYALLQPQYAALRDKVSPRSGVVRRVLVYFGAADAGNLTGLAVDALLELARPDIYVDVVVDPTHAHAATLGAQLAAHPNFRMHGRLPTLAPLMQSADLAIGAGGATSWERCCQGLPALVITLADNQRAIAAELDRLGVLGWLGHQGEVGVAALRKALGQFIEGQHGAEWSRRALALVDGLGAGRVAEMLLLSGDTPMRARPAAAGDEALLLHWANDPAVRQNSFNQSLIDPAQHHRWFASRLGDAGCRIYIVETELGQAVGQVRLEREEENWVIDYSLGAPFRQRGLGCALLTTALAAFSCEHGAAGLKARVKAGNVASCKVFQALGFKREELGEQGEVRVFHRSVGGE